MRPGAAGSLQACARLVWHTQALASGSDEAMGAVQATNAARATAMPDTQSPRLVQACLLHWGANASQVKPCISVYEG